LSGLVVRHQGKLKVYNRIYELVFNPHWVEETLDNLRPYAESLKAWLDSNCEDCSQLLRGEQLQTALTWAVDKYLSYPDYRFLAASQQDALQTSEAQAREKAQQLEKAIYQLQHTQMQLIQTEKMLSVGQLVAGVAHEIQNPASFIYGNLNYAQEYAAELFQLLQLYQEQYPSPVPKIQEYIEAIDLDFLMKDFSKLLGSMQGGAERICDIVRSMSNFSQLDKVKADRVDIHKGIDNSLMILQNRLKAQPEHPAIEVIKEYGTLPAVECFRGQLYQVFINLLNNAIDALEGVMVSGGSPTPNPQIWIRTAVTDTDSVSISIADNGLGMSEEVSTRIFEPFFTTKPVGKGTGLGLSISYQIIVEKHGGELKCFSALGEGAKFVVKIPIRQQTG
jgi:signal transduction histidine kinase